jgi:putative oxidoreductase
MGRAEPYRIVATSNNPNRRSSIMSHPPTTAFAGASPYLALLGRLLLAVIFLLSGYGKLTAASGTIAYIESAGLPAPTLAYAVALVVELVGGLLLVVGFQTRLAALVLALFTVAAAFGFHSNFADQNQTIHFLKNIAIAGGLLQVVAFGAGALSFDARRQLG